MYPELPQPVQRQEAGESGTDHDRVEASRTWHGHKSTPPGYSVIL
jgi:hypothetical protein